MEEERRVSNSTETHKLSSTEESGGARPAGANLVAAIALIVLGVLLLLGQLLHVRVERFLWPLFIIVPGVVLLVLGLSSKTKAGEGLTVAGTIVTTVGGVLFYQNATNHWQSWAYAWALVGPTAAGLGQVLYGSLRSRPQLVKDGAQAIRVGLILFAVGFLL